MSLLHTTGALRAASPPPLGLAAPAPAAPAEGPGRAACGAPPAARRGLHLLATVALTAAVAACAAGLAAAAVGVRPHVEVSDSMRPTLRAGDLVWLRQVRAGDADVGDVVAFRRAEDADVLLHRVIERRANEHDIAFTTRGDANTGVERWSVPADARVGRTIGLRLPHAGRAVSALAGPPLALLAGLGGLGLAWLLLRRIWR